MSDSGDSNRTPAFPWMLGGAAAQTPRSAPKRRQTMAEMLRSSELMGSTVALHEAVEAAQEAAARKAEATEAQANGTAVAEPAEVANEAPAPAPAQPIADSPAMAPVSVPTVRPRAGGNRYHLYAKINGIWSWQFAVDAGSHGEGLTLAVARLTPQLAGSPIRLEQDEATAE